MDFLLGVLTTVVVFLIARYFLPAYFTEKGKNLATREDVGRITEEVERVKIGHARQLQHIEHQNSLLMEEIRGRYQLRMAAVEKRLEAHQSAFALWRRLLSAAHTQRVTEVVNECQAWWDRNCLYLSPEAREAFNRAYFAAHMHSGLLQDRSNVKAIEKNWADIMRAGEVIVSGAELPTLGEREALSPSQRDPSAGTSAAGAE